MSLAPDAATFVSEPVAIGKKGQKVDLSFTVSGLPNGSNPVVGVFDKQGKILGRTEWQSKSSGTVEFKKHFAINHANSTLLTFSVYNASDSVSATDYLGGVTADVKNLLGNGGKNEVTEGAITFAFNAAMAQGKQKAKKEEKKVDPAVAAKLEAKRIAKVDKEGGKKAQDIAGLRDMGGVSYFHVAMESCEGDFANLDIAMKAMNRPCPEDADERRGGAEDIGKVLMSYNDERLAFLMNVPPSLQDKCSIADWYGAFTEGYPVVKHGEDSAEYMAGYIKQDADNNIFPMKIRDEMINKGFAYLKAKNLVLEDDDDDDEMVFGDDDFYM